MIALDTCPPAPARAAETLLFCALCCADVEASATTCHRCGGNPASTSAPCPDCEASGTVVPTSRCGRYDLDPVRCERCDGHREVEAPFLEDRELISSQLQRQGVEA